MTLSEASLKRKRDAESIRLTQERMAREWEQNAYEKGFKEGFKEGVEIAKRAISLKLKKMGIPLEDITQGTGLSIEEIEKL